MAEEMETLRSNNVSEAQTAPSKPIRQIACAFCKGRGIDPFGILSSLSSCQVCGGTGKVEVEEPTITCAFCKGSGVFPIRRLNCTVCGGKGMVPKPKGGKTCPDCRGRGMAPDGLPDLRCHGIGMI